MNVKRTNTAIRIACFIGMSLSIYALHVEMSKKNNAEYVALCDINEHMSCSSVFESSYGAGFGLFSKDSPFNQPNSLSGIIFYSSFFLLSYINHKIASKLLIVLAALSQIFSVYLACILIFILHDFCIVCVSTYIVNASLLYFTIAKAKALDSLKNPKKSKLKER